jgi:protein gp37
MAKRLQAMGASGYANGFQLALHPYRLDQPRRRQKQTIYFVNSMSDLFHEAISDEFLDRVFSVMRTTPQHTYQVLTKRAQRLPRYFSVRDCPANLWLGVSVENRKAKARIDCLREVGAKIRFLSVEPLLEDLGGLNLRGIDWVIVGGESGPHARPMNPAWVSAVHRQCAAASVSFFFKQWGTWGADGVKRDKKANGRRFAGRVWDEMPAVRVQTG